MGAFSNLKPHMDHAGTQPAGVGGGSHLGAGRLGQGFPRALTGLSRVGCHGLSAGSHGLSRVSHGLSRTSRESRRVCMYCHGSLTDSHGPRGFPWALVGCHRLPVVSHGLCVCRLFIFKVPWSIPCHGLPVGFHGRPAGSHGLSRRV